MVWGDFLRRRALLVKHVIDPHTDGYRVPDVRDQIRSRNTQGESGVVDVVNKVVHFRRFDVHEAVDSRLRGWASVGGEGRRSAAEDQAEIRVEGCEESILARAVLDGRVEALLLEGLTNLY